MGIHSKKVAHSAISAGAYKRDCRVMCLAYTEIHLSFTPLYPYWPCMANKTAKKKSASQTRASSKGISNKNKKQYDSLHELLILKLQSLYDTEQELLKVLPKLAQAAANQELKDAFEMHEGETKRHVERLEQAMQLLGVQAKKEKVAAIRGIAEDGGWVMKNIKDEAARDAALIAAAQYAEHYEIAGYGSAREWAAMMDHQAVADLLETTLMEEQAANDKLSELAHNGINQRAGGIEMAEEISEEERILM
jgi:ferritin-like metal-binding protein YciE